MKLASRMESTGVPGAIQVAASTWHLCRDRYVFTPREVDIKGPGATRTYLLDPRSVHPAAGPVAGSIGDQTAGPPGIV